MSLPYFYLEHFNKSEVHIVLDEDTSKHMAQVLRMKVGDGLQITDGKGNLHTAEIVQVHKKSTSVKILSSTYNPPAQPQVIIAISLIKNTSRFEWFLEKATEIGAHQIIPLICERTEKHQFRLDRMKSILVSAMLQSQQCWLPILSEPISFKAHISESDYQQKFIAHCLETDRRSLKEVVTNKSDAIILIGPEGDFTQHEIELALQQNFLPVTLGDTRLRTETAGVVAITLLKNYG